MASERGATDGPSELSHVLLQVVKEMQDQRNAFREELRILERERRSERCWAFGLKAVVVAAPLLFGGVYLAKLSGATFGPFSDVVGLVEIKGEIGDGKLASADKVVPALKEAFENPHVKQVVLAIDSPGGAPVESERINGAISYYKSIYHKPVTAVIGSLGASAAYMIAMHADRIVAGRYSLVGSIGAVMAPWQLDKAIARFGVSQRVYASGPLKAFMNPFTPPTRAADKKAQDLVDKVGKTFVAELIKFRGKRLRQGVDFGTGEVWSGEEAARLGLVDGIGTISDLQKEWPALKEYRLGPREKGWGQIASAISGRIDTSVQQAFDSGLLPR